MGQPRSCSWRPRGKQGPPWLAAGTGGSSQGPEAAVAWGDEGTASRGDSVSVTRPARAPAPDKGAKSPGPSLSMARPFLALWQEPNPRGSIINRLTCPKLQETPPPLPSQPLRPPPLLSKSPSPVQPGRGTGAVGMTQVALRQIFPAGFPHSPSHPRGSGSCCRSRW